MKNKLLLSTLLTALVANHAFALEIYKGRIVDHKEWTTGNAKVIFKEGNINNALLKFKQQKQSAHNINAYVLANTRHSTGIVGEPASIDSVHFINVSNDSSARQNYYYTFGLCADDSDHTARCAYYYDQIQLEPGGYLSTDKEPVLQIQFDKAGSYSTSATAYLQTNVKSDPDFQIASSSSSTIDIATK